MQRLIIGFWPVFAILAGGLACSDGTSVKQKTKEKLHVEAIQVQPRVFSTKVTAVGDLLANEDVEIKSPVSGNVMDILYKEGEQVHQGELLVKIDDRAWQARKKGLEAQLASAVSDLRRKENLLEVEGASQAEVEQARASVDDLKARIDEMRLKIDLAKIHAPFSGQVGMRDFSKGAFMAQGERITRLVQSSTLRVNFTLPAKYSRHIHKGMDVNVVGNATGDTVIAKIYAINPVMDVSTRSLNVRARLNNDAGRLMPGDFVEVSMLLNENPDAILIPAEAIIPELNSHVLYTITNGKAERRQVKIGKRTKRSVEIEQGLQQGDTVMVTGLLQVRAGQQVEVKKLKKEGAL